MAAITLDARGGGVAAVSRLVRRVFEDQWGHDFYLLTLLDGNRKLDSLSSSTTRRLGFGAQLAGVQAFGRCPWVFYSHLHLARVQSFIPVPLRRPHAVFVYGIEAWRPLPLPYREALQGAALRIAISRFTARRVAAANPGLGSIVECPLALAPGGPCPPAGRDEPGVDLGQRAVILVARMLASERYKGHDELLDAWPAVLVRVPAARLVFVGDGDDTARLGARATAIGVAETVTFTGFVTEAQLHAIYRRAAVFAMPSSGEGFGMVYLEAMSHRLPCIGSVHDAASEVLDDGVTGFLVEQANSVQLADRIVRLLTDEARRVEMGENGYHRLQRRFTYDQFSRTLLSLIETSLGVPAAAAACTGRRLG